MNSEATYSVSHTQLLYQRQARRTKEDFPATQHGRVERCGCVTVQGKLMRKYMQNY